MKKIMTTTTPLAMPAEARVRVSTGAFAGGRRAADLGSFQGTGAPIFGYTPAVVDVVQQDEFPGDMAWSPPI